MRESQNLFMTGAEARALATAGTVAVPRGDMPFTGRPLRAVPGVPEIGGGAMGSGNAANVPDNTPGLPPETAIEITLGEAIDAGLFGNRKYDAVRKGLQRDDHAPQPVGRREPEP